MNVMGAVVSPYFIYPKNAKIMIKNNSIKFNLHSEGKRVIAILLPGMELRNYN